MLESKYKQRGLSITELLLLSVVAIVFIAIILPMYFNNSYKLKFKTELVKFDIAKTKVALELEYGQGHIQPKANNEGLYGLAGFTEDKDTFKEITHGVNVGYYGELKSPIINIDGLGIGEIVLTPYLRSKTHKSEHYMQWDCAIYSNELYSEAAAPKDCSFISQEK